MQAILRAPVDLLWNGGIGPYVKAGSAGHVDAAGKANDAIRVDGSELRVRCGGEGGKLGLTQRRRIQYAATGARTHTDFTDNSAGADTSDHEVNIKILLGQFFNDAATTEKQRNTLLASMTDEVAALVLNDNYEQNLALANAAAQAPALLHVHEDWMRALERKGVLNRELEALPSRREVAARIDRKESLTVPELSVLMAYTKILLEDELLDSDLPHDPFLRGDLFSYFPSPMRQEYRAKMETHQLRREIIVTQIVNQLVNHAGMTYFHRLAGETSATASELTRAHFVAREIYGAAALDREIGAFDNKIAASLQTRMRLEVRTLVERASRWLVNNRRHPMDSEATVDEFGVTVEKVMAALPDMMTGAELAAFESRRDQLVEHGVPEELASRIAVCPPAYMVLGVVQTSLRDQVDPLEVAGVHFAVGEQIGLPAMVSRILALPRNDRWQTMARAALRDDLHSVHAQLTAEVLGSTDPAASAADRVAEWEKREEVVVRRAAETFEEITADETADLARMSVALRVVRSLLPTS
jgi:glutamate dehydrogenase